MRQVRIRATPDGSSYFEEFELDSSVTEYVPGMPSETTAPDAARSVHLVRMPAGTVMAWHASPRPHCAITLSGEVEIAVGDGERRRFGPGELYFGRDTTGQGHETRAVGEQDWVGAVVTLAE